MSAEDEFDIVVIGGGPGGYATALYGAAAGLSVAPWATSDPAILRHLIACGVALLAVQ